MKILYKKNILIILSGIILLLFIICAIKDESKRCMGLRFITEEEIQQIAFSRQELGNIVCLYNTLLPYNEDNNEVYIPCNITSETKFHELEGRLQSSLPEYELYFIWNDYFNILSEAIRYDCRFTIFAIDSEGNFATCNVVFTTLPIIEMHGELSYIDE